MHLFDARTRFYGGNAIVGGGLPVAVGLALADAQLGSITVTACYFVRVPSPRRVPRSHESRCAVAGSGAVLL